MSILRPRSVAEENSARSWAAPPMIHQPAPGPEGQCRRRGRLAEDGIDDNINRAPCGDGQPARQTGSLLIRPQHHHVVSTDADGPLPGGLRSADGDHPAGPQMPGHGERHLTYDSARAEYDHPLTGAQPGTPAQRHPGGDAGCAERSRGCVGDVRCDRDQIGGRHGAPLGQAAVDGRHPGRGREPHPLTGG